MRNGSVIDLQIAAGRVRTLVSGSDIYEVDIQIKPIARPCWTDPARRKRPAAKTQKTAKKPQILAAAVRKAKSRVKAGKQTAAK